MKRRLLYLLAISIFAVGCSTTEEEIAPLAEQTDISLGDINKTITSTIQKNNDVFDWSSVSSDMVSNAARHNGNIITVGYQPEGFQDVDSKMHEIDINSKAWTTAKANVIAEIQAIYDRLGLDADVTEKLRGGSTTLPYFHIETPETAVIERLRTISTARYIEPFTYEYVENNSGSNLKTLSGSGCGDDDNPSLNSADYTAISPNAKVPWTYYQHNIPAAWSYSKGNNIGVGLIDTGLSPNQSKLGSQFASGYSTNRSVYKYGTYVSSWWWWADADGPNDDCGHGTSMAGAIAAPRAYDGMSVGVAYEANLYSVRAAGDVIISSGSEKDGVSDAYVLLAKKSGVKIISMSLGTPISSGQVADAVRYAYGRGKLIFNAAGTSLSWTSWYGVIFPANMNETVAVTGIKDNGYNRCDVCHDGSKVDFVVTMQRNGDGGRTSMTLPRNGNGVEYVGGSSVATAMTAGTAALVWAKNPSWSRTTVLNKLKNASEFYPSRSNNHGWGKIDVLQAVQ
jgi:serine protease